MPVHSKNSVLSVVKIFIVGFELEKTYSSRIVANTQSIAVGLLCAVAPFAPWREAAMFVA